MTYSIRYKKNFFWRKIKKCVGHKLEVQQNRMVIYLEDGSVLGIGNWDKHSLRLGTDWVLFTKKQMEKESGQDIKLNANLKLEN